MNGKDMRPHGTTILAVRRGSHVAVAGDGQVTMKDTIMKHHATKVRKMYSDQIIVGFAGATADALNLYERFEAKLERYNGNLTRSAVELAKDWRTDKYLRRLEAVLVAVDSDHLFLISGNGDVIEPDEGVLGHTELDAKSIADAAMRIAACLCIYTNEDITIEEIK
jgi:ATP-dependent HslUV protease subunit HslV